MNRGAILMGLRLSHAAGIHDAKPTRSFQKRQAIEKELDMSTYTIDPLAGVEDPTPEDLMAIDLLDEIDYDDDDFDFDDEDEDDDLYDDLYDDLD